MHPDLPFISGVAVQRYLTAEEGLEDARVDGCTHWYVDMSKLSDLPDHWSAPRRKALAARSRDLGMTPIIHGNFRVPYATEIVQLRESALRYLQAELQLASDLGAPAVIVHGGAHVEPKPTKSGRDATLDRFIEALELASAYSSSTGIELWLENLSHYPRFRPFTYVFTRYEDYSAVLDSIPGIRFILDIGHANVNQSMALPAFKAFAPSIAALSLSNNDGNADEHLGLGRGTLAVKDFLKAVRDAEWNGIIAFETRDEGVGAGMDALRAMWLQLDQEV